MAPTASRVNHVCLVVVVVALAMTCPPTVSARPVGKTGAASFTKQIVTAFQELSSLSDSLRTTTDSVTVYNAAYKGYKISQGLSYIKDSVDRGIQLLERGPSSPLNESDAKQVVAALTKFAQVHLVALDAVINKHGLVTLVPYVEGIRQALLNLEEYINRLGEDLIDLVPSEVNSANQLFGRLGVKLHEAIATYEEPLLNAAASLFVDH